MIEKNLIRVEFTLTKWNSLLQLSLYALYAIGSFFLLRPADFRLQSINLSDNILMLFFRTCNYSARLRMSVHDWCPRSGLNPDPLSLTFRMRSVNDGVLNNYLNLKGLGGVKMAKCDICGRGAFFGNQVSHSHRRSNKVWHANVQRIAVKTAGGSKKIHVCTRCMRSGKVERA